MSGLAGILLSVLGFTSDKNGIVSMHPVCRRTYVTVSA